MTLLDIQKALDDFNNQVSTWLLNNSLTKLLSFKELQDKDKWGVAYRDDQWYYENIADLKSKYFSLQHLIIDTKDKDSDKRLAKVKADVLLESIKSQLTILDNELGKAKQRLKFYETITYVVGNLSYGAY